MVGVIQSGRFAAAGATFDPTTITGCKVWLDSSDASTFTFSSGSSVSQWRDKSGNSNHFAQSTAGNQPTRSGTQNGLSTVVFDGVDDYLSCSTRGPSAAMSCFAVVANRRANISASIDTVITTRAAGAAQFAIETSNKFVSTTQRQILNEANTGTEISYKNGSTTPLTLSVDEWTVISYTVTGGIIDSAFYLCSFTGISWFGQNDIASIIIFDSTLGTTDRQTCEAGLKAQWGTP